MAEITKKIEPTVRVFNNVETDLEDRWHWKYDGKSGKGGQSILHEELSNRSVRWISNRASMKGCRATTEIKIAEKYIVDSFALCGLTNQIFESYCRYAGIPKKPWQSKSGFTFYSYNFINDLACVFETKVSRADFKRTFNDENSNRLTPIASLHWCVTPKGLIEPQELPDFWGLLEAYGRGLTEKKKPLILPVSEEKINEFSYKMLWKNTWNSRLDQVNHCPDCYQKLKEVGEIHPHNG